VSPEVLADGLGRNPPLWTDGWRAFSAMDLDVVLEQETPTNIVFLDACRKNSLDISSRRRWSVAVNVQSRARSQWWP
jgi:hypothetical protein